MNRRFPGFLAALAALTAAAPAARAGFVAFLTDSATDTYRYTLRFTADLPGEQLMAGDLITLYNFAPAAVISSATVDVPDAANFTITQQPAGLTPPGLADAWGLPAPLTDNLSFLYTGPALTAPTDFTATIITLGGLAGTTAGMGAGQTQVASLGEKDDLFPVLVPQLPAGSGVPSPEPASLSVLGAAVLALLARRRPTTRRSPRHPE